MPSPSSADGSPSPTGPPKSLFRACGRVCSWRTSFAAAKSNPLAGLDCAAPARWADAARLPPGAEPLPWYLEERFNQGAFATFLGVVVDEGNWQALAVGDSCLFHIRDGAMLLAFPLTHSGQFGNSPWLIGSRTATDEVPLRRGLRASGDHQPGDRLRLMTDALSRWFLHAVEVGQQPWLLLEPLFGQNDDPFAEWVGKLAPPGSSQRRYDARCRLFLNGPAVMHEG